MKVTTIFGPNASGKTLYVEKMRRQMVSDKVRYIAFRDSYGIATDHQYYLQLRWNQHDIDAEMPDAGLLLEQAYALSGADTQDHRRWKNRIYSLFDIEPLLDKHIIALSSGELRKFQLVKMLMAQPSMLILDNPFIGLDSEARQLLYHLLEMLASEQNIEVYLVVSRPEDIPAYTTNIINIGKQSDSPANGLSQDKQEAIIGLTNKTDKYSNTKTVVDMRKVNIRYGERTILNQVDWCVLNGEHWALSGQNGAGKSTLLSLICADNPQAYACDISLFGHRRGSGESIWEIKRHIGYVSPEMHRSYQYDLPALKVVASGLKDTVGLYVRTTPEELEQCRWWMSIFGISHLAERSFMRMSSGEQRLVLLARAFVKDPQLLILDEPLHGLDNVNRSLVSDVIETFCKRPNKTLIFVSHYRDEYPACIDHELCLRKPQN
jgi:molybdate transport system ATP-binding protein